VSSDGALILVVGPSGAGKDSILRGARAAFDGADTIRFARRYITRAPGADEDNVPLLPSQFIVARALGGFILSWDAHGLSYGLPASIGIDLARGVSVVANVSREIVGHARALWPRTFVILVTASPDVLRGRLMDRGRDADIDQRLARSESFNELRPDFVVVNDDDLGVAIEAMTAALERIAAGAAGPERTPFAGRRRPSPGSGLNHPEDGR
jgi:phosphonate metabolism protein PhnN/1,5-bisphosphokinase (PRPP-forming)